MEMEVIVDAKYDDAEKALDVDMRGEEIGILIGKRGQTLDSLQYLVSLSGKQRPGRLYPC